MNSEEKSKLRTKLAEKNEIIKIAVEIYRQLKNNRGNQ